MCTLAAEESNNWLMVDPWEAFQSYQRTAIVLDHFDHEINTVLGGVRTSDGEHRTVRPMLLAGSDLIATMSEPGVWSYADVCSFVPGGLLLTNSHHSSITFSVGMGVSSLRGQVQEWIKLLIVLRVGVTTSI